MLKVARDDEAWLAGWVCRLRDGAWRSRLYGGVALPSARLCYCTKYVSASTKLRLSMGVPQL
jgi:hypothetical protein